MRDTNPDAGRVGALDPEVWPVTAAEVGSDLSVGGLSVTELAARFGTPLHVVDAATIRDTAGRYLAAFGEHGGDVLVCFASKAFPSAPIGSLIAVEGLGADVASEGELAIALKAGFEPRGIVAHGNAKSYSYLRACAEAGVGTIVVDGPDDVTKLRRLGVRQDVLIRLNPGLSADTHPAMATAGAESKFGVPRTMWGEVVAAVQAAPGLTLLGAHVHIGSQLLDLEVFDQAVDALADLPRFPVYDLGGGLGVRYADESPPSIEAYATRLLAAVRRRLGSDVSLIVEPGRSLVARAGVSLYTVQTVKRAHRTFVAVDGGMGDNLEVALYGAVFSPRTIGRTEPAGVVRLVGQHCETGDVLASDAVMALPEAGDLVAVPTTGAYTYSLANNYNAAPRPAVVIVDGGIATLAVRRETIADLIDRDVAFSTPNSRLEEVIP